MAQRRMFSKEITTSDTFVDMPMSSQLLYFHLGMEADDEGFIGNAKMLSRAYGANSDDLSLLKAKGFIIMFENGVSVVKDWNLNNKIRKDRIKPTIYRSEKSLLNVDIDGAYYLGNQMSTECQPIGNQMSAQVRLGKDRLGKDVVSRSVKTETEKSEPQKPEPKTIDAVDVESTRKSFELWEQLWGFPNAIAVQEIDNWINTIGDDMLLFAVNYAGSRTVKASGAVRYISKIVEGWRQKNITTVEQAEKANQEHEQRMSTERGGWSNQPKQKETLPDWAKDDYEPEKKETTPEELAAIQAQMARLQASKDDD